jgi:hypothetical protein
MDRLRRHCQRLAGVDDRRRLAVEVVLQRPFQDIDDLFARMLVPDKRRLRTDVDPGSG